MHHSSAIERIGQRAMHAACVVPDHQIAYLPLVAIHELRLGCEVSQAAQQRGAAFRTHSQHVRR